MSNHLKYETSPYLLQHAQNPVDWYPWGQEAFERARTEDKPIFLSIGYSTCHWCHVMAHESFEDESTARILNRHFISIKVDREERPDIDSVYMSVCQAFTGSGGWPMTIFMTWDKKPFFAGTYFPAHSRYGMPDFSSLLHAIADGWQRDRTEFLRSAEEIIARLRQANEENPRTETTSRALQKAQESGENSAEQTVDTLQSAQSASRIQRPGEDSAEQAVSFFQYSFDAVNGGFGYAPKFPTPHNLLFLLYYAKQTGTAAALEMTEKTLLQMGRGGIFDQIGGGFSRYSTDPYFLVPHFEKMLYDNALLVMAYASAYAYTFANANAHEHAHDNAYAFDERGNLYLDIAERTAEYVLRELTSPEGAFYCAQDADSGGAEGEYYTFSLNEVLTVLGEEKGRAFSKVFDITAEGNFDGKNIPNLLKHRDSAADYREECQKLYEYRKKRSQLHRDDKLLTSWNALMITALAMLYRASGKSEYLSAARKAQEFIARELCDGMCLYANCRIGFEAPAAAASIASAASATPGPSGSGLQCDSSAATPDQKAYKKRSEKSFLDDYAFYICALLELHQTSLEDSYLQAAEQFCAEAEKHFADAEHGGYFLCRADASELFLNPKETFDGAIPSANSVMAYNLVRLYQITEKDTYRIAAERQLSYLESEAQDEPTGHGMYLLARMMYEYSPEHIIVIPKQGEDLNAARRCLPFFCSVSAREECSEYPLIDGKTTCYVCTSDRCLPPFPITVNAGRTGFMHWSAQSVQVNSERFLRP